MIAPGTVLCGSYLEIDWPEVDAVISDPPYCQECQSGHDRSTREDGAAHTVIAYEPWTAHHARLLALWADQRARGWVCLFGCDHLAAVYREALEDAGRVAFAPLPVIFTDSVRKVGDGPASAAVYLAVARPRNRTFARWGALPGWYRATRSRDGLAGAKPLPLMRKIVRHYTRPGDLVADPCAGWGSTLVAATELGRSVVGSDLDGEAVRRSINRIADAQKRAA